MSNIYKINNDKFKGICISYNLTVPTVKEQVAENAVLSAVLSKGSKRFKTQKEIDIFLSGKFGAVFDVSVEKIGDLYNLEFRIECINKKFLPDNVDVVEDCLDFLKEIVYNPNVENNKFESSVVEREKQYILDKISERKDDKLRYAVTKTEELLCENEPFGVYVYGREQDVEKISNETLIKRYVELISDAAVTVIVSGNLEGYENIEDWIKNEFADKLDSKLKLNELSVNSSIAEVIDNNIREISEKAETAQSVITMGLRIENIAEEDVFPLFIYNAILGDTPSSKLFQNFREKESLAYTVRSRYYRYKSAFIIYAGIEKSNYDRAKKVIIEQLDSIKNGEITEEEFNASKHSMVSDLLEWNDSKVALVKMVFSNLIAYKNTNMTLENMIEKVKAVTVEDVVRVSKKIKMDMVYILGGETNA